MLLESEPGEISVHSFALKLCPVLNLSRLSIGMLILKHPGILMEILKLKIKIKTNTVFRLRRIKKIPFKIELRTPHAQPMLLPLSLSVRS